MAPMPSSYVLFCQDKRQEHKEAGNSSTLDVRTLGAMWRELTGDIFFLFQNTYTYIRPPFMRIFFLVF
jgi:hypothetical protein